MSEDKSMSEWISVEDELPEEPKSEYCSTFVDLYIADKSNGYRKPDCEFRDDKFWEFIEDYQGDYSHMEEMKNVTHWMYESAAPSDQ